MPGESNTYSKDDRELLKSAVRDVMIMGRRTVDIARFEERVSRAMSGLRRLGVGPDTAVAILMRNDLVLVEATIAIERLGGSSVPLNWHANPGEIRDVLLDAETHIVIAHADLKPLLAAVPTNTKTIIVETPEAAAAAYNIPRERCLAAAGELEWESWLTTHIAYCGPQQLSRGAILYTSGTTGSPKGIQRLPAMEGGRMDQSTAGTFGVRPGVRSLICGPLYHSMQRANMRTVLSAIQRGGGLMLIEPRFDAERLLQLIQEYRVTQMMLVPIMFVRLLRLPEVVRKQYDVSSLESVVHGAAPCPVAIKKRMIEWWGPIIDEFYATTETGAVTFVGSQDFLRKPGTVGRVAPGCTVKILDERGQELPAGCIGEIAARNSAYPDFTYRNHPEERAKLDRNGLIATGDIGYLDADEFLFLCDRKKDMVISGGVNIFPSEIEAILLGIPGVKDCAVFGIPDDEYGELLAAHIEPMPGINLDENLLRQYIRQQASGLKVPKVFRFEGELPRDDSGKIYKRRLAEPYWRAAEHGSQKR